MGNLPKFSTRVGTLQLNVAPVDVIFRMNAEELAQTQLRAEELNFDAHEFDGLREAGGSTAKEWLRHADRFVRDNPWLCIGLAAAAACAIGWAMAPRTPSEEDLV